MLYLLDANVLIDAARDYYPIERIPEFWDWLIHQGRSGVIKVAQETCEEIAEGDALSSWLHSSRQILLLEEEADPTLVSRAIVEGYADDLTDVEVEKIGRDPFLVAYALQAPVDRCIVTTESSKPTCRRANRRLPDVCGTLGLNVCHTFVLTRTLNFSTGWNRP